MKIYIFILYLFCTQNGISQTWTSFDWFNSDLNNFTYSPLIDEIEFIDSTTWMYSSINYSIISYKDGVWSFIDPSTTPSLPSSDLVVDMEAASSDTLWICYSVQGLHYYLKSTNTLYSVSAGANAKNFVLNNGDVWFTSGYDHAVYKYDGSSLTTYDYTTTSLPDTFFIEIRKGLNDEIWTLTRDQLIKFDGSTWTPYNLPFTFSPNNYTPEIDVDSAGNVWITQVGKDFAKFDGTSWTTYNIWNSSIPGNDVETLYIAKDGTFWMGIRDVGLVKYDGINYTTIDINALTGWTDNAYTDINEDIYGNIWVAPFMNIFVYNPNGLQGYLNINEEVLKNKNIYPNPSNNGVFTVDSKGKQFDYIIHSIDGRIVSKGVSTGEINIQNEPKGIYILDITNNNKKEQFTLVID